MERSLSKSGQFLPFCAENFFWQLSRYAQTTHIVFLLTVNILAELIGFGKNLPPNFHAGLKYLISRMDALRFSANTGSTFIPVLTFSGSTSPRIWARSESAPVSRIRAST